MKGMTVAFAPIHDKICGGHWIWDEETAKANFDFTVSLYGTQGRFTLIEWFASFQPYKDHVEPLVGDL